MKQRHDVIVGKIWRDRDPRSYSGSRRVRVLSAQPDGFVEYRQVIGLNSEEIGRSFRSRYDRFQRAFEPMGLPPSADAVDPQAASTGTLSTREKGSA